MQQLRLRQSRAHAAPATPTETPMPSISRMLLFAFIFCNIIGLIIIVPSLPVPEPDRLLWTFGSSYAIGFGTILLTYALVPLTAPTLQRRGWSAVRIWVATHIPANFIINIIYALVTLPLRSPKSASAYIITWLIVSLVIALMATTTFVAVNRLFRELRRGREALRRNAALDQELALAHEIQANMLPKSAPQLAGIEISGCCYPAREVGGDLFSYNALPDGRLSISIGDVSGKSVPAAMLMGVTLGALQAEIRDHREPARVLEELHSWLSTQTEGRRFVALSNALIDPQSRQVSLANAGQLHPILRQGGETQLLDLPPALPLGTELFSRLEQREITLDTDDLLIFFTDGIVEAPAPDGELFGFDRLLELTRSLPAGASAEQVQQLIMSAVDQHTAGHEPHDDMTLMIVRFL